MNKTLLGNIGFFGLGVAIGGIAAWYEAKRMFSKREKSLDEDFQKCIDALKRSAIYCSGKIDEVIHLFTTTDIKALSNIDGWYPEVTEKLNEANSELNNYIAWAEKAAEPEKEDILPKTVDAVIEYEKEQQQNREFTDYTKNYQSGNTVQTAVTPVDPIRKYVDVMDEIPTDIPPYVISPSEFGENDFDEITLYYFQDQVITDTDYNIIKDVDGTIGFDSLNHVGDYEPDVVLVRNEIQQTDYEVLVRGDEKYSEVVAETEYPQEE